MRLSRRATEAVAIRVAVTAIAGASIVVVPARAVQGVPLPKREGVVIAWQAKSSTAVVVTDDQRAYAIHALRRVAPGTRVRVDGIKWGTPTSGIKWGTVPSGVKWGVKWGIKRAANGSYQSRVTPIVGKARTASLRGTVVRRFGGRGVAVSIPGSTVVIPLRGAVWLPGGKRTKTTGGLGQFGSRVAISIRFDAKGRPFGRRVTETAPASALPTVPVAGTVVAVDVSNRTLTVAAGTKAFPVNLTIAVPASVDLERYPVNAQVAAVVVQTAPDAPLASAELSLNGTFAQADTPIPGVPSGPVDPAGGPANPANPANPGAPAGPGGPPAANAIATADQMQVRWADARAQGLIPNTGLFTSQRNRLERVASAVRAGDKPTAVAELTEFELRLSTATASAISTTFRDEMITISAGLRALLA